MQSPVIESRSHQGFGSAIIGFFVKLIVMAFLTVDMTGVMVYLLYTKNFRWMAIIPIILAFFAGLSAGILSRLFFFKMPRIIRWFLSCLAVIATLAVAGFVGQQWLQIDLTGSDPPRYNNDFVILSVMGWVSAFLAIFAWSSRSRQVPRQEPEQDVDDMMPAAPYQMNYDPMPAAPYQMNYDPMPEPLPVVAVSSRPAIRTKNASQKIRWRKWKKKVLKVMTSFVKPGKKSRGNPILSIFVPRNPTHRSERLQSNRLQIRVPEHRSSLPGYFPCQIAKKTWRTQTSQNSPVYWQGRNALSVLPARCKSQGSKRDRNLSHMPHGTSQRMLGYHRLLPGSP